MSLKKLQLVIRQALAPQVVGIGQFGGLALPLGSAVKVAETILLQGSGRSAVGSGHVLHLGGVNQRQIVADDGL